MEVDPVQLNLIYDPNPKCSNYGCTASRLDLDLSAECVFHPGKPVFHEGYKYWDCCKRKSLGFDDFLNQKGCTKGEHCWTPKPKPEPKETLPEDDESLNSSTTIAQPPVVTRPAMEFRKRPDPNEPLLAFEIEVSPSLEKQIQEGKLAAEEELPVKTCQNSGCSVKNSETESNPICYFHSGEAVFHEGLKYWSCCKKKAFEFEQFLKQKGCKEGEHRWLSEKKVDCRFDWHQTGSHVILAIYAK